MSDDGDESAVGNDTDGPNAVGVKLGSARTVPDLPGGRGGRGRPI